MSQDTELIDCAVLLQSTNCGRIQRQIDLRGRLHGHDEHYCGVFHPTVSEKECQRLALRILRLMGTENEQQHRC